MRGLRKVLGGDERYISTVPGRGYCFVAPVVRPDGPPKRSASTDTNLPQPPTEIVGRERELAELRESMAQDRLVTVLGPAASARRGWRSSSAGGRFPIIRPASG